MQAEFILVPFRAATEGKKEKKNISNKIVRELI